MAPTNSQDRIAPETAKSLRHRLKDFHHGIHHIKSRLTQTVDTFKELVSMEKRVRRMGRLPMPTPVPAPAPASYTARDSSRSTISSDRSSVSSVPSTTFSRKNAPLSSHSSVSYQDSYSDAQRQELMAKAEAEVDHLSRCVDTYDRFFSEVTELVDQACSEADAGQDGALKKKKSVHFDADVGDPGDDEEPSFTAATPRAYAAKLERVQLMENLQMKARKIAWSNIFLDFVHWDVDPEAFSCSSSETFHDTIKRDVQVTSVPQGHTNAPLRWAIMEQMYKFLKSHVLTNPLVLKHPLAVPRLATSFEEFFYPFIHHLDDKSIYRKQVASMLRTAVSLRELLSADHGATYSFKRPRLNLGYSMLHRLDYKVNVLAISGASHADDSRDVVQRAVFGALVRYTDRNGYDNRRASETRAYVTAFRPEPEDEMLDEQELGSYDYGMKPRDLVLVEKDGEVDYERYPRRR